jgi:hypothetical protein
MARGISAGVETAIESDLVRVAILCDLNFSSPIYLWTGIGTKTHDSKDYLGVGDFLSVNTIQESQDLSAKGIALNLSGLSGNAILTKALSEEYQGKTVSIKLACIDASGNIISNPVIIFDGFMDVMSIQESGSTSTITLSVESKLIQLGRSNVRRYNMQDQRAEYPNDAGFDYVTVIAEKDTVWGGDTNNTAQQQRIR